MNMTRDGIVYNLSLSPYIVESEGISFYFSSTFYMNKFIEMKEFNRSSISTSLTNRFKMPVILNSLADLILYDKTEKRGFYVQYKGMTALCLNQITLSGEILTIKS